MTTTSKHNPVRVIPDVIMTPERLQQQEYRQKLEDRWMDWHELQLKLLLMPTNKRELAELLSQEEQALYINPQYGFAPDIESLCYEEIDDPLTAEEKFWEWLDNIQDSLYIRGHYVKARQLRDFKEFNTPIILIMEYWNSQNHDELNENISPNSGPRTLSGGLFSPR